jgi:hypothetical protein
LPGTINFALALGLGLAFLARQQRTEFLAARYQFVADRHQDVIAALEPGLRPLPLRGLGRIQRTL